MPEFQPPLTHAQERKLRWLLLTFGFSQADVDDEIERLRKSGASVVVLRSVPETFRTASNAPNVGRLYCPK